MGRGLGHRQRAILAVLDEHRCWVSQMMLAYLTSDEPTDADLVSVRRALKALADRGLIRLGEQPIDGGAGVRWQSCAMVPDGDDGGVLVMPRQRA